jgi:TPR repeat protein
VTAGDTLGDRVERVLDAAVAEGICVSPADRLRILALLAKLQATGRPPRDGPELGRVLSPLLARSAEEQARVRILAEAGVAGSPPSSEPPRLATEAARPIGPRLARCAGAAFVAALAVLSLLIVITDLSSLVQAPVTPPSQRDASGAMPDWLQAVPVPELPLAGWLDDRTARWYFTEYGPAKLAALLLPWALLGLALWPLWRSLAAYLRQRDTRRHAEEERVRLNATGGPSLERRRLAWAVQRLRRICVASRDEIAVEASVRATAAAAGRPVVVVMNRSVSVPYIALVERLAPRDHQADLLMHLVRTLQDAGLHVDVWEFSSAGGLVQGSNGRVATLEDLLHRHPDRRLLLLCDGTCLIDPVSGDAARWTGLLLPVATRVLLTPRPATEWGSLEAVLTERLGFRVEEATPEGIQNLANAGPAPSAATGGLPRQELFSFLQERSLLWTGAVRPARSSVRTLLDVLSRNLDDASLRWLRALAVYPELRLPLTLYLRGHARAAEGPAGTWRRLLSLARLPWLRAGTMPEWLRRELLSLMSRPEEEALRAAFQDRGTLRGRPLYLDVLRSGARSAPPQQRDGVFLEFAYGMRRLRGLRVRPLERLASLLRLRRVQQFLATAALGMVLAACLSGLSLSVLPLDACDVQAADRYDRHRVGAGVTYEGIRLRPDAVAACLAAVARDPSNARWQYQLGFARALGQGKPYESSFLPAAKLSYPRALGRLAYSRMEAGDPVGSQSWMDRLIRVDRATADWMRAAILRDGISGVPDIDGSFPILLQAVAGGVSITYPAAAILEQRGELKAFVDLLRLGARRGEPEALNELGYWMEFGLEQEGEILIARNRNKGVELYARAAAAGYPVALYNFGNTLIGGESVAADRQRGCGMLLQSANLGNQLAYISLGQNIARGNCKIKLDPLRLYEHAAEHGVIEALLLLGDTYALGQHDAEKDVARAQRYYEQVLASSSASNTEKNRARQAIANLAETE